MSVLPIKPNLAERAIIYAITFLLSTDPVLHHLTSSPSSRMAAYQRMFLKQDPTGVKSSNCLLERMLRHVCMDSEVRQMCEDAEDRASNAQEEARQKRKEALEEVVQQIYRSNN
ncbi:hypothetical protein Tco_0785883 [Tanacetum coccineum]